MNLGQDYQLLNNNIQENTNYNIYLKTNDNINATYNWWGTTDQSTISHTIYDYYEDFNLGKVTFVPFLTAPNLQAPTLNTFQQSPSPSASTSPTKSVPEIPLAVAPFTIAILLLATTIAVFCRKTILRGKNAQKCATLPMNQH